MELSGDRISNLPGNVIEHILSCLPICEAAATSILSTQWRDRWFSIPSLTFEIDYFEYEEGLGEEYRPESIVTRTLLLHTGPIHKFRILSCTFSVRSHDIDCWFKFLSNHPLQVLEFFQEYLFEIPRHFFSFDRLTHLSLTCSVIKIPSGFKGFNRLVSLNLYMSPIGLEDLNRFLSECVHLEFLEIFRCTSSCGHLNIRAPKLNFFKFEGLFCSIFLDAPGLDELSIKYSDLDLKYAKVILDFERVGGNLISAFGYLPHVTKLEFDGNALENPAKLESLTVLQLWFVQFEKMQFARYVMGLIRSSPNLQSLVIDVAFTSGDTPQDIATLEYLKEQEENKALLPHLKNVEIRHTSGSKSEMEFIRLILLWANVLEKLVITWNISIRGSSTKVIERLQQLAGFRRASSNAAIVFH